MQTCSTTEARPIPPIHHREPSGHPGQSNLTGKGVQDQSVDGDDGRDFAEVGISEPGLRHRLQERRQTRRPS
jgi:hypothetical protein